MREYIVSGVPLRDPLYPANPHYFVDYTASTLLGDAARIIQDTSSWGSHGVMPEDYNYFTSSRETLVINVLGEDKEQHNALLRGFQGLFTRKDFTMISAPQRSLLAAGSGRAARTFGVATSLQRVAAARGVGSVAIERINERTARITVLVEIMGAFWRSVDDATSVSTPITTATQTVSLNTVAGDSNAPLTVGKIRIKGPISVGGSVRVFDRDTMRGVGFKAQAALLASEYVLINLADLSATKVSSDVWAGGIDFNARIETTGEGGLSFDPGDPSVFPGQFGYSARVVSSGYTSGSTAVQFRLNRSYTS